MSEHASGSLARRVWEISPRRVFEALRRRLVPGFRPTPPQPPDWVEVRGGPLQGRELLLSPTAAPSWAEMVEGTYDRILFEELRRHTVPGERCVLWDVGAHFGYHTLSMAALAKKAPGGKVLAFEPNPANANRLRQNLRRNPDLEKLVELVPVALSNTQGHVECVLSEDIESGDSSCTFIEGAKPPRDFVAYDTFKRVTVPTTTADAWLVPHPDCIPTAVKMDVEGAEWLVLQGASELLRRHRPMWIVEVHDIRLLVHIQNILTANRYATDLLDEAWACPSRCCIVARPGA